MKQYVSITKLCGAPHPTDPEASCARPSGHTGWHLNGDNSVNWTSGSITTVSAQELPVLVAPMEMEMLPLPPCAARHPMGRECARPQGHQGNHATADHLLSWATFTPPRGF